MSGIDLDTTARPGTMGAPDGEVTMATHTTHTQPQAPTRPGQVPPGAGPGGRRSSTALYAIAALVVTALIVGVGWFLFFRDTTEPTPQPTPEPTAAERAADEAAAVETIEAYTAEKDKARQQGTLDGTRFGEVADTELVENEAEFIASGVRSGYVVTGSTVVASAEPAGWSTETQYSADKTRTRVEACIDSSGVSTVDSAGNPVQFVNPDGSPDERTRKPVTYFVEKRPDGTYFVEATLPAEDRTATC